MWWNRKKREIIAVEQEKLVILPSPKHEWAALYYNLIYHFKDREDYTYLFKGSYITEESHNAVWQWEMKYEIYFMMYSAHLHTYVGEYTVQISANKTIQQAIANGLWIDNEFITPHRITGCTRVELDREEDT